MSAAEVYPQQPVYIEIVERLLMAQPKSHADFVQVLMRGARPKPEALLVIRNGHFHALIEFETPLPDGQTALQLPLGIMPERGR